MAPDTFVKNCYQLIGYINDSTNLISLDLNKVNNHCEYRLAKNDLFQI